jgi:hypothetical protein
MVPTHYREARLQEGMRDEGRGMRQTHEIGYIEGVGDAIVRDIKADAERTWKEVLKC